MAFDGTGIRALLDDAAAKGAVHGIAAVVVDRDGELFHHAAGEANARTMFRNASMTKAVATTAALQLVEQGEIALDDAVESVLPEFGKLQVLDGFDANDKARLRAPASKATIRQLMTHSTGLGYFFLSESLSRYHAVTGAPHALTGLKASLSVPMVHDPGTAWEYGVNTDWLGLVVEKVSGQSLAKYLQQQVYEPLRMNESTFAPTTEDRSRLLRVMQRRADGKLEPSLLDLPAMSEWESGGHGSYGTIQDYGRFVQAWLNDGRGVLKPETAQMALQDHLGKITLPEVVKSQVPLLANDVPSLPFKQSWGLGFHLMLENVPGMRSAGTADWAGVFNTYYWIDRTQNVGGVLMTQLLPFFDDAVVKTLMAFEAAVYQQVGMAVSAPQGRRGVAPAAAAAAPMPNTFTKS